MTTTEKLRFQIRVLSNGTLQARCPVPPLVADGANLGEVRTRVAAVVRDTFGQPRPFALMLGHGARQPSALVSAA